MKRTVFLLSIFMLMFTGCGKKETEEETFFNELEKEIEAEYEADIEYNGITSGELDFADLKTIDRSGNGIDYVADLPRVLPTSGRYEGDYKNTEIRFRANFVQGASYLNEENIIYKDQFDNMEDIEILEYFNSITCEIGKAKYSKVIRVKNFDGFMVCGRMDLDDETKQTYMIDGGYCIMMVSDIFVDNMHYEDGIIPKLFSLDYGSDDDAIYSELQRDIEDYVHNAFISSFRLIE